MITLGRKERKGRLKLLAWAVNKTIAVQSGVDVRGIETEPFVSVRRFEDPGVHTRIECFDVAGIAIVQPLIKLCMEEEIVARRIERNEILELGE